MIIVEGPDGAGKTTLVQELVREFDFMVGERAVADRDKLYTVTRQDTHTALARAILTAEKDGPACIWDRLFYSEMVYAPVVGRPIEFAVEERLWIRRIIEAAQFPVILCLPPRDTVRANSWKDDQMPGVKEGIDNIWDAYARMANDEFFPQSVMMYDYSNQEAAKTVGPPWWTFDGICNQIQDYLDQREKRTW